VLGCDVTVEVCANTSRVCVRGEIDCGILGDDDFEECADLP
jgi:hypothetical protein